MNSTTNENKLLKLLALSIVENPRSTIKELAESAGISKATLHRFCGTREKLEKLLMQKSLEAIENIICIAEKDYDSYVDGLRLLINAHYENMEFLRFVCGIQACIDNEYYLTYSKALDSFFLRGQKKGTFRIDFSVTVLSELFIAIICGMIDAERRGRVASSCMVENIENFFLYGSLNDSYKDKADYSINL